MKKHLRQFAGFEFDVASSDFKKRVESTQKLELPKLKVLCENLQLDKKGPKDAISQRICEFLVVPHKIDAPTDDEEEDEEDEEEAEEGNIILTSIFVGFKTLQWIFQWTEEEDEEPEVKPKSKGRGNARNAVSKAGRPRRSTAGRGKGKFF